MIHPAPHGNDACEIPFAHSFEHQGLAFNLLDAPGHQDFSRLGFSEDTYRTLTAADSAVMALDAAPNGAKEVSSNRPASSSRSGGCATCRSSLLQTSSTARAATRSTCWAKSSSRWRSM